MTFHASLESGRSGPRQAPSRYQANPGADPEQPRRLGVTDVEVTKPATLALTPHSMPARVAWPNIAAQGRLAATTFFEHGIRLLRLAAAAGRARPGSQALLFAAVARLLESLGTERTAVVALEDLHWADASTLDLLTYLVRTRRQGSTMLVGTYRTDELDRRHPLRSVLAEMTRLRGVERVLVGPLDAEETAAQLTAITGAPLAPAVAARIHARGEGNPFYAEELLAAEADGEHMLPDSLRNLLVERYLALPEQAQRVLRVASVFGRSVDDTILARVWDADPEELTLGLRLALASQLLTTRHDGESYRFRHALVQEAVHGELLPRERQRLHAALAEALTATGGAARAEVARHWYLAKDPARALAASVVAGAQAVAMLAHPEALSQYERAVELWEKAPEPGTCARTSLARLLLAAADAAFQLARVERALGHLRQALEVVDPADMGLRATLHCRNSHYVWFAGRMTEALNEAEEAVRLVPPDPPTRELALVAAQHGRLLKLHGRYAAAVGPSTRAVEVARAVGARAEEGAALNSLGSALVLDDPVRAVDLLVQARDIAEEDGDVEDLMRAYSNLTDVLRRAERYEQAVADGYAGLAHLGRLGTALDGVDFLRCNIVRALFLIGRWDEAHALHGEGDLAPDWDIGNLNRRVTDVQLAIGRGDLATVDAVLAPVLERPWDSLAVQYSEPLLLGQVDLAWWRGDLEAVGVLVEEAFTRYLGTEDDRCLLAFVARGLRAAADRAALARRDGEPERERVALLEGRELLTRGEALLSALPEQPGTMRCYAEMASARADGARLEGRSVPEAWDEPASRWSALGVSFEEAAVRWRQGEAALETGRRDDATRHLGDAHLTAIGLGARLLGERIVRLARRGLIDIGLDTDAAPSGWGLTGREREVLDLVIEGMTNPQIGTHLFISEKTASVHVSNILRKLGVSTRTEAAAVAVRSASAHAPQGRPR